MSHEDITSTDEKSDKKKSFVSVAKDFVRWVHHGLEIQGTLDTKHRGNWDGVAYEDAKQRQKRG